jgi:hypothetical protein
MGVCGATGAVSVMLTTATVAGEPSSPRMALFKYVPVAVRLGAQPDLKATAAQIQLRVPRTNSVTNQAVPKFAKHT